MLGTPVRLVLAAAVLFAMAALLPHAVQGQEKEKDNQGKYLKEATERLSKQIARANEDGFILSDNTFSVGGAWLKQGSDWVNMFAVTLNAGTRYRLIAAGDFDAKDVDLQVTDVSGKTKFAEDVEEDAVALVNFTPKTTQKYMVRVRVYASNQNLPCMCLAIVMVQNQNQNQKQK
jgi:hypothetical protein